MANKTKTEKGKLVLVGQAPSRRGDPEKPLQGDLVVRRLAGVCGMGRKEYMGLTDRYNVLRRWPGKKGKGDHFPMRLARRSARRLALGFSGRRVILLGRSVAKAFGLNVGYLKWVNIGFDVAVVPHPSGINRWWNEARNKAAARRFMEDAWGARRK
jgi:uracil-DNA glycosylase